MSDEQTLHGSAAGMTAALARQANVDSAELREIIEDPACGLRSPHLIAFQWLRALFSDDMKRARRLAVKSLSPELARTWLLLRGAHDRGWELRHDREELACGDVVVAFVADQLSPLDRWFAFGVRLRRRWPSWVVVDMGDLSTLLEDEAR